MIYRLKATSPEIDAVDGPLAGRKFKHGEVYDEIPEGDKGRFEDMPQADQPPRPAATPPYQGGDRNKSKGGTE